MERTFTKLGGNQLVVQKQFFLGSIPYIDLILQFLPATTREISTA